ncbi:hypothetical protein [Metabacillus litoralis]|uniref:hypothetical protein n=1 Tax=Metabacillus litoralis TaxID=152268 RepID=UPI002041FDE4|nr:hypothetical protein [Metabacillus litoralis]MCM3160963.1 hypothetical protein [Metabacillus litoralis]
MPKEKTYQEIKGVFIDNDSSKYIQNWSMNFDKLAELTSEEFADEIKEVFDEVKDMSRFNAQIVEVSIVNTLDDKVSRYEVSLGHFIYSHHYTYLPYSNDWYRTIINQDFFNDIVKPFQEKLNW